nr:hypothetical protein [Tanacetum cinerariifolium]
MKWVTEVLNVTYTTDFSMPPVSLLPPSMVRNDVDRLFDVSFHICCTRLLGIAMLIAGNPMVGQNVGNGSSVKGGIQRRNDIYMAVIEVNRHELMNFECMRIRLKRMGLLLGLHIR